MHFNFNNLETGGLKKSKSIGRSIKKLFTIGKNNRGTVIEPSSSKTGR